MEGQMKTLFKVFLLFAAMVIFLGCATSGAKYVELSPTIPIKPDTGRIFIYRPSVAGAAIQPDVKLNGEVVGSSTPYGFFYVDRAPGVYEIMTSTEVDRKLSLTLDKGQTRFVRINISIGFFVGHVYPELVDQPTGEKEIQDCRYTGK
jgi:hypothetical protein